MIEKIRMREVEDEYHRLQEAGAGIENNPPQTTTQPNSIIPVTPLNPLQTGPKLNTIMEEAGESPTPLVDGGTRPPGEVSVPVRM
jgi:hypothetical protein